LADELEVLAADVGASSSAAEADDALNRSAYCLGRLVGAGLLAREDAEAAVIVRAAALHLDAERSARTIGRALDAGATVPATPLPAAGGEVRRCSVPLARAVGTTGALIAWHARHLGEQDGGGWFRYSKADWIRAVPWLKPWTVDAELKRLVAAGLLRCRHGARGLYWRINWRNPLASWLRGPSVAIPLADLVRFRDRTDSPARAEFLAAVLAVYRQLARRGTYADAEDPTSVRIAAGELATLLPPAKDRQPPSKPAIRDAVRELVDAADLELGPDDGHSRAHSYRPKCPTVPRAGRAPHRENLPPETKTPCASAEEPDPSPNPPPKPAPNAGPRARNGRFKGCGVRGGHDKAKHEQPQDPGQDRTPARSVRSTTAPSSEDGIGQEGLGFGEVGDLPARPPSPHRAMLTELLTVCGLSPATLTRREMGGVGKAAADLLRYGAAPAELGAAAERYRALFPEAWCTPLALRKHWFALGSSDEKVVWRRPPSGPARDLVAELTAALAGETWSRPREERDREREERGRLLAEEAERARQLALLSAGDWTRGQGDEDYPTRSGAVDRGDSAGGRAKRFEDLLARWGSRGAPAATAGEIV
jgi:hypothetical protein